MKNENEKIYIEGYYSPISSHEENILSIPIFNPINDNHVLYYFICNENSSNYLRNFATDSQKKLLIKNISDKFLLDQFNETTINLPNKINLGVMLIYPIDMIKFDNLVNSKNYDFTIDYFNFSSVSKLKGFFLSSFEYIKKLPHNHIYITIHNHKKNIIGYFVFYPSSSKLLTNFSTEILSKLCNVMADEISNICKL